MCNDIGRRTSTFTLQIV